MESETKKPIRMSDGQRRSLEALLQAEVISTLRLNRKIANTGASKSNNYTGSSDVSLLQKEPPIHSNALFIIEKITWTI